jgi:Arc/MetJ family transcription regulator
MRTRLSLDDDLLAKASALTGIHEKPTLIHEALKAIIERESARRLAMIGGSEPKLIAVPRRRAMNDPGRYFGYLRKR